MEIELEPVINPNGFKQTFEMDPSMFILINEYAFVSVETTDGWIRDIGPHTGWLTFDSIKTYLKKRYEQKGKQ